MSEWILDACNTITSVNQQQSLLQTQITMQQNKMIADAAEATWDACMWSYNKQQEAQLLEAQMTSAVLPRIVKAGVEAGVEAAIYAVTYNEIVRQTQNGDAKAVTTVVAVSFGAGFVAGSCMEIWRIIEEAIICP